MTEDNQDIPEEATLQELAQLMGVAYATAQYRIRVQRIDTYRAQYNRNVVLVKRADIKKLLDIYGRRQT